MYIASRPSGFKYFSEISEIEYVRDFSKKSSHIFLIVSIFFIGGMQLLAIGIVGQYIGKIYVEVKRRPRYNIEEELMNEETKDEER